METEIKQSLIALLDAIKRADGQIIAEEVVRLDELASRGRMTIHPQLSHFLQQRSYAKALMYLEGDTPPSGICGTGARRTQTP